MRTALIVLLASVIYATARYHGFEGVAWSDWPAFTLNKAFALAALVLLVAAVMRIRLARGKSHGWILSMAGIYAAMHVILSLVLLSPAYYAKLFVHDRLTAAAGWSMLLGAIAAVAMAIGARLRGPHGAERLGRGGLMGLAIVAFVAGLHAALQGFGGWFAPSKWPGMMPPITLIAFVLGVAAVGIGWGWRKEE